MRGRNASTHRNWPASGSAVFKDTYPVQWAGGQAVVTLPEHIDAANVGQIREELLMLINRGAAVLIVDMTATASCGCAGAEALVHACQRAAANGTQLRLVVPAEVVRRVLSGNGIDRLVSVYPSREAAIAARLLVAQPSAPGPPQVSQDLLGGIVRNLFHAGLSLQAALDTGYDTERPYITQALWHLDQTIRDIRDHIYITRSWQIPPSSGQQEGHRR